MSSQNSQNYCHCEERRRRGNPANVALNTGLPRSSPAGEELAMTEIEKSIFATIAYYDYFNYPLTIVEVYQYLINLNPKSEIRNPKQIPTPNDQNIKPSFSEIIEILDNSENLKKFIGRKNGFYFLTGREGIIKDRIQKKKLADEKLKKSKWILKFISCLPFIRFMALSGSMSIGNPDKKSDIDLLVVAKAGRIWTTRAFLTFFALALGAYRHSNKTANRLCLNHYITDKTLAIDFGNLYKAEEYLNLFPVSGDINIYKKFIGANAGWLKKYIYPNFSAADNMNMFFIPQEKISAIIKQEIEYLLSDTAGDWLENQFKKIQVYCIEKNPLTNHPHSRIRYTDNNLVFHPILVEPKIIAEYEEKMGQFNANLS